MIAPLLLSLLAGLKMGHSFSLQLFSIILLKILVLAVGAIFIGYYGFRCLRKFISSHMEKDFMPLLIVGIALTYAGIAVWMGLSEVLGAFLAGVMLSETGQSSKIEQHVLPLRDIALPFFFFWFGTSITWGNSIPLASLLIVLVVWAVIGKIMAGYFGGKTYGLTPRVSLRAGFSLIQRGEFSAIIASLAAPHLRIFSGLYIVSTILIGVYLFQKAPILAKWLSKYGTLTKKKILQS